MKDTRKMTIGERIKYLREDHEPKISQKALAKAIGREYKVIQRIEKGATLPAEDLEKIAAALDSDPIFLVSGLHAENFELEKDIGLSDNALNILTENKALADQLSRQYPYLTSDVLNPVCTAIDALIQHPKLATMICNYLYSDFSEISTHRYRTTSEEIEGLISVQAKDVLSMDYVLQSFEPMHRLEIMDELHRLREEYAPIREERLKRMDQRLIDTDEEMLAQAWASVLDHIDELNEEKGEE